MCDLARVLGKDVAELIGRYVHNFHLQALNEEYLSLLVDTTNSGGLAFRGFYFNHRLSHTQRWIASWQREYAKTMPKNY